MTLANFFFTNIPGRTKKIGDFELFLTKIVKLVILKNQLIYQIYFFQNPRIVFRVLRALVYPDVK